LRYACPFLPLSSFSKVEEPTSVFLQVLLTLEKRKKLPENHIFRTHSKKLQLFEKKEKLVLDV
jgi:hypothetical protein